MAMETSRLSPNNILLIIHCAVDVKSLRELQKEYPWPRPSKCPQCGSFRLWRHGFAPRYFDEVPEQLWILKYRCPECKAVHTMRPSDYDRRFSVQWIDIFTVLFVKILIGRWSKSYSKERQRYWMKGFCLHASRFGNVSDRTSQLEALAKLTRCVILGTHSTRYYEMRDCHDPPHLFFRLVPLNELL